MKHVIIMGSRGYTKSYGGWETLVHGMLDNWTEKETQFYVTELSTDPDEEEYTRTDNGIECIRIPVKHKGTLEMVEANAITLFRLPRYIKKFKMDRPILYVLGARVGFLFWLLRPMLLKHGVTVVNNTDGMGWLRGKYSRLQKLYSNVNSYFFSTFVLDYVVADAQEMGRVFTAVKMRHRKRPYETRVIYYGTNEAPALPSDMPANVQDFFDKKGITPDKYYLIINRFVPENSYELILQEFTKSKTDCDFIMVTNQEKEHSFYERLKAAIPFEQDKRIKFVGTVYDKEILAWLRQKARGYINGHTLGGTNPGLLEALATTNVNLVRDCPFSREGAGDTALYFDDEHPLSELLVKVDGMPSEEREELGRKAKVRMRNDFSWRHIDEQYVELFNYIINRKDLGKQ